MVAGLEKFAIVAPDAGMVTDYPSVIMNKALSPDSENTELHPGYIRSSKMRLARLKEAGYSAGGVIVPAASTTVYVLGASIYTAATHYPAWGGDDNPGGVGRSIRLLNQKKTVKSVDSNTQITLESAITGGPLGNVFSIGAANVDPVNTFKFTGDAADAALYTADGFIVVYGSTGNDGIYKVVSATHLAGTVTVTVNAAYKTVDDATGDGYISDHGTTWQVGAVSGAASDSLQLHVATPDGLPIIHYESIEIGELRTLYLFAFTADHVYLWDATWSAWILKWTNSSSCTHWSTCIFNGVMIATNGVDKVLSWGGTVSAALAPVTGDAAGIEYSTGVYLTKAKYVAAYNNMVWLQYTTENGTTYPNGLRNSDIGDQTDWDTGDAAFRNVEGYGFLGGFGFWREVMYLFKEGDKGGSVVRAWKVDSSDVIELAVVSRSLGCKAPDSVVNDKEGTMYFFATDFTIRDQDMREVSGSIANWLLDVPAEYVPNIRSHYNNREGHVGWAIPKGLASTTNNRYLKYYPKQGPKWQVDRIAVAAFGHYVQQTTWTVDTVPFDTIDEWDWEILDMAQGQVDFPIELAGGYKGYTWAMAAAEKDKGAAFTSYAVFDSDLSEKGALDVYKRLLYIDVLTKGESGGSLTVQVQSDYNGDYETFAVATLTSARDFLRQRLAGDIRFRSGKIRVTATNTWALVALVFHFRRVGER